MLTGRISLRRFTLMVNNLPPGNPLARARYGPWGATESLLHHVESRLRELVTMTANIHREKGALPHEVEYLPRPKTPDEEELDRAQAAYDALMQQQLEQL